jgi:hypothetical protein
VPSRLGTIFYLAYLLFEYPQNLALQRFPVGKWMSLNILVWSMYVQLRPIHMVAVLTALQRTHVARGVHVL